MGIEALGLSPGMTVVAYLHSPKEKIWGLLVSLDTAGVVLRGLDLATFDDWLRQEARGDERLIGLSTLFYPMSRLERLERDESCGPLLGYAERFEREIGESLQKRLGLPPQV